MLPVLLGFAVLLQGCDKQAQDAPKASDPTPQEPSQPAQPQDPSQPAQPKPLPPQVLALEWPAVLDGVLQGADLPGALECAKTCQGDAKQVADAVDKLKKRDAKDIGDGLAELGAALGQVPQALQACNGTEQEAKELAAIVQKLKDPKFAEHDAIVIGENLLLNGAAIGEEILQASADAKANNSAAFGSDVGKILGQVFGPRPALHKPDWPQVALGVIAGFAGFEGTADQLCLAAAKAEEQQMNNGVQMLRQHTAKDVEKGLELIADALKTTPQTITSCKDATKETLALAQQLEQALKLLKHPLQFAFHVGKDLVVNGRDILKELEGASQAYEAENWQGFGAGIGEALEKLLVGADEVVAAVEPEDAIVV